jgi:glycosyltransferase involved in cell wall biosynthesis
MTGGGVDGTGVTVVIPTKNRRRLLDRAISSVLGQQGVDVSVIVVDDGSEDRTAEFVARHSDQRVQVLRHEVSQGVSLARNAGLALVTSPWVSFLDDDDVWSPHKLRHQLAALRDSAEGRRWVLSAAAFIDDNSVVRGIHYPLSVPMMPALLGLNVVPGGGSGVLAATELVRTVGGFDHRLSNLADWDMWIRLAQCGEPATAMEADVGYYLHRGSMSLDIERSRVEHAQIRNKYADLFEEYAAQNDFPDWHNYLGDMCKASRHWREALVEYRRAGHRSTSMGVLVAKIAVEAAAPSTYDSLRRRYRRNKPISGVDVVQEWLKQLPTAASLGTG